MNHSMNDDPARQTPHLHRIQARIPGRGMYECSPAVFERIAATYPPRSIDGLILAVMMNAGHGDHAYWDALDWASLCVVLGEVAAGDFGDPQ